MKKVKKAKKKTQLEDPHRIHAVDWPMPVGFRLNVGFKLLARAGDMDR